MCLLQMQAVHDADERSVEPAGGAAVRAAAARAHKVPRHHHLRKVKARGVARPRELIGPMKYVM